MLPLLNKRQFNLFTMHIFPERLFPNEYNCVDIILAEESKCSKFSIKTELTYFRCKAIPAYRLP